MENSVTFVGTKIDSGRRIVLPQEPFPSGGLLYQRCLTLRSYHHKIDYVASSPCSVARLQVHQVISPRRCNEMLRQAL
jgi:hypothetical protein